VRPNLIKYRGDRPQKEMALKYNVSQQAWSNWEHGRDTPRPATMLQIAKDAEESIESLFFDYDNNPSLLSPTGTDCN